MIAVTVNDKPYTLEEQTPLIQLLKKISLGDQKGIAVAVNQAVIPRKSWETIRLSNDDKILIIQATQGG